MWRLCYRPLLRLSYYYPPPSLPAAYNCERFDPCTGKWSNPNHIEWLSEGYPPRIGHVAWMSSIGLFLIGGSGATDSSMLINKIGQLSPGLINSGKYG